MYYYNLAQSGERLKELRNKKGKAYTQEKVAEEVGISREYLNRLEAGKKGCSVDLLVIFAQYYDVTMDYITYGKEEIKNISGLSEKMDKLPKERRILAGKLINSILDNLL
ncbi:MAG: helix-turn-helix domain-containing protein [Lachnospiraceae bacterium]|nr:helix-turn-helix domain-containing protein [Lachnospiraceae bacterium]